MFTNKFDLLSSDFKESLKHIIEEIGIYATANKYHKQANMSYSAFYRQLKNNFGTPKIKKEKTKFNSKGKEAKLLSEAEEKFLAKLEKGEVSLADASKLVATKVFRKMLEYPDDVKFIDFFRTELLKLKQDENKVKETWSKELIARMFAGHLPPNICPHCGKSTVTDSPALTEGKTIYDADIIDKDS